MAMVGKMVLAKQIQRPDALPRRSVVGAALVSASNCSIRRLGDAAYR